MAFKRLLGSLMPTSMDHQNLDGALNLHRRGFFVMPLIPNEKRPVFEEWQHATDRPQTEKEVRALFLNPNLGVGVCGGFQSNLTIVDVDVKDPDTHLPTEALIARAKMIVEKLPPTLTIRTPSKGFHLYYQLHPTPRNWTKFVDAQIDFRTEGGFVVAPPTLGYTFLTPLETPIAKFPQELLDLIKAKNSPGTAANRDMWRRLLSGSTYGSRNSDLARVTGKLLATFVQSPDSFEEDATVVISLLRAWNQKCSPPLDQKEFDNTVNSILNKHYGSVQKRSETR